MKKLTGVKLDTEKPDLSLLPTFHFYRPSGSWGLARSLLLVRKNMRLIIGVEAYKSPGSWLLLSVTSSRLIPVKSLTLKLGFLTWTMRLAVSCLRVNS